MKIRSLLFKSCLAVTATMGITAFPAKAESPSKIVVSYQPSNYWALPFYLANKMDWWKVVGLDASYVKFPAGMPQMASSAAGSWDVGATGSVPAVFGASRFDIVTIGADNDESLTNLLIADSKTAAELKADPRKINGQTIFLTMNSTADYVVQNCVKHMGGDLSSVHLVNLGQAAIVSSMISGSAKLGGLWAPFVYTSEEKAGAKVVCTGDDAGVKVPGVLIARQEYAKKYPERVAAFLAVYIHAWNWAKAHPVEADKALQAADEEAGVPLSDYGVSQEFKRPTFTLQQELALMDSAGGASTLDIWMDKIGAFLETAKSIQKAPAASSYVTDIYMKMVQSDPKLRAFAESSN